MSNFWIMVSAAALVITTTALPNGVEGSPSIGKSFPFTISDSTGKVPSQFSGLKSCTVVTPWPSETLSGDCSAHDSPNDPEPAVYNGTAATVYTDPVFGTKIKRLTPQRGMPTGSYVPKYAPYQSWSKNGTYLILSGPGGNGYLFKGTDPYTFIRQVWFPAFDGWDEPQWFWSNTNDCLLLYINSNQIQTVDVCKRDAETTLATFNRLTDTQGHKLKLSDSVLLKPFIYCHQSNDDTKIAMVATGHSGVQGFGVFSMDFVRRTATNTWFHIVTPGGDLPETGAPQNKLPAAVCISPQGNYVEVQWNTYWTGRVQDLSSLVRSGNVVTATSQGSGWPRGIVTGATISIDSVNSDTSFNGTFALTGVSGKTATYNQTGANSSLTGLNTESCKINGNQSDNCGGELDYQYYGIQQFNAATGAAGPLMDRAGTHNDQMMLADSSDAMLNAWNMVHHDYRRYGAYEYGFSSYDASNTPNPEANIYWAQMPDAAHGSVFHLSGQGSTSANGLLGWALVSTYASTKVVDCSPQIVYCAEIMAVKMDGSNTFYRIAHTQSIQGKSSGSEMYYAEPHATPSRDFTHIVWGSNWRNSASHIDAFLVELP